jgi:hypothetical protein
MNLLRYFLIAVIFLIGLVNSRLWRHDKAHEKSRHHEKAHPRAVTRLPGQVHDEIIKNAERLQETLARVRHTAQTNKETRN